MLIFSLYWSLLILCSMLTISWGGRDGKIAATIVSTFPLIDFVVWSVDHDTVDRWYFPAALDVLQLICLAIFMARSSRWWPIWMTGFQVDAVLAHASGVLVPWHATAIFRGLHTFWGTPILVVMALGAWLDHRVRLRR